MNREQALALLRAGPQGVREWNGERQALRETGGDLPGLGGASLRGADLSWADLSWTDLHEADLRDADLRGVDLSKADLRRADLREANLSRGNLSGASFRGADLGKVRLVQADLRGASFVEASLRGARLRWADLADVALAGADLAQSWMGGTSISCDVSIARGLEDVRHEGPSLFSAQHLLEQSEELPEVFLRGCGLSDAVIELYRSQLGAVRFYSCFISYSSRDDEFARRLHADLQDDGVRCWFAPEDIKIGDRPLATINEAIRLRDKLVLILSAESIDSDWVEHEVDRALEEEERRGRDVLFPIRIDDAVMKCKFGWAKRLREAHRPTGRHIGDFCDWRDSSSYRKALDGLLTDLKRREEETSASED